MWFPFLKEAWVVILSKVLLEPSENLGQMCFVLLRIKKVTEAVIHISYSCNCVKLKCAQPELLCAVLPLKRISVTCLTVLIHDHLLSKL